MNTLRHCEQGEAIHDFWTAWIATACGLAMTRQGALDCHADRHGEERCDAPVAVTGTGFKVRLRYCGGFGRHASASLAVLLLAGCASSPSSPPPGSVAQVSQGLTPPGRLSADQSVDVTVYALGLVGTPYRYGGNTPQSGFDCSGLIGHVYQARAALAAPRSVAGLKNWGQPISKADLRSGDLVLFLQQGIASHAGIYVGNNRFVHAPSNGGKVRLDALTAKYWSAQPMEFRRP